MFFKQKTIRLKGKAYTEFRAKVFEKYGGKCQKCRCKAPLYDQDGQFSWKTCGHVSHIKGRGAGGGDVMENVKWLCPKCHLQGEHGLNFGSNKDTGELWG